MFSPFANNYTVERLLLARRLVGSEVTVNDHFAGVLSSCDETGLTVTTWAGDIRFTPIEVSCIRATH